MIDRESKINPFDESGERPDKADGVISLRDVNFSYPTRPDVAVLQDFSLDVPAGKVTALVVSTDNPTLSSELEIEQRTKTRSKGPSGSGKSTIIGLLERWYNPTAGTITLDGREINKLSLSWLRTNVRLVQQV